MIDRQLLGDVVLAALVAIPTAALARPEAAPHHPPESISATIHSSAVALAPAGERQVGIYR
jgi:hypothetical protein